ncbi:replicative DNA helicase [Peptoniphilus ivorii]|uniref:replicative DNA helicase n=1 Tax=Aedoeadaptatus ivorii TaxID=54006 RepID=UPI002785B221|nr:replicative DNA helicase [Peptoniphilus ivorii]MDQ0508859.1 replicative DNA helicase [Peptoniphilus ivorii]
MDRPDVGRTPPYDEQAEISVLGAMLLEKSAITTAIEILRVEDFYYDSHKAIYEGILSLYNQNEPADLITLSAFLKKSGQIDAVGGYTYLGRLTTGAGAASNTEAYANIVKEKATLRELIRAGSQIVEDGYRDDDEVGAIIEKAEKTIFDITQDNQRNGLVDMSEVMVDTFTTMQERAANKGGLTGLTTGFIDLDRKLSGLQKADLVLLAARPSMGKTALMVNISTNAAIKAGATVAMFSLEMSRQQLSQRILSSICHVDLMKIISGDLSTEEWTKVIETMTYVNDMHIMIDDTAGISPLEVKAKCRRLKAEKGLDLVVIDYLQLMEVGGRAESRQQEISAISRQLKGIAKELDVPVIALSQLSRAPEMRADHRPILSDLRESGAIEQDADIVMFLYRDEYYNPETEKQGLGEVIIAKHRNGPTGTVELLFKNEYTKFVNLQV